MRSDIIKKGFERAPHRSLLKATGVRDEDMDKPFIAVCNSFVEIVPGHVHLNKVGEIVKQAIREAGGVPFEFNTIGVDDGIAMGHTGMKYSLPSRELITDGRFSGGTRGACIGHVSPEAAEGGPIGLLQPGDIISINIPEGRLEVKLSDEELNRRRRAWTPLKREVPEGWLRRYAAMATSASTGAVLRIP